MGFFMAQNGPLGVDYKGKHNWSTYYTEVHITLFNRRISVQLGKSYFLWFSCFVFTDQYIIIIIIIAFYENLLLNKARNL